MADKSHPFPQTLFVQAGGEPREDHGRDFFGMEKVETMNDGAGCNDGEEIAVYQLVSVKRAKVTWSLEDES